MYESPELRINRLNTKNKCTHTHTHTDTHPKTIYTFTVLSPSQVVLQPVDVASDRPPPNIKLQRPDCETKTSMETLLIVNVGHRDPSVLETSSVHQPVIPQHVILTCYHVRPRTFGQNLCSCQQWRSPDVQQSRNLLQESRRTFLRHHRLVVLLMFEREENGPVIPRPQLPGDG